LARRASATGSASTASATGGSRGRARAPRLGGGETWRSAQYRVFLCPSATFRELHVHDGHVDAHQHQDPFAPAPSVPTCAGGIPAAAAGLSRSRSRERELALELELGLPRLQFCGTRAADLRMPLRSTSSSWYSSTSTSTSTSTAAAAGPSTSRSCGSRLHPGRGPCRGTGSAPSGPPSGFLLRVRQTLGVASGSHGAGLSERGVGSHGALLL